jgi:hypothetical protein
MNFSILASTLNFESRLGRWGTALPMTRTTWMPCEVPQSAQRVTATACAHLGTGWTEKQDDSPIDETNQKICETQIILK